MSGYLPIKPTQTKAKLGKNLKKKSCRSLNTHLDKNDSTHLILTSAACHLMKLG